MHSNQATIIAILHKYAHGENLTEQEQSALDAWLLVPEQVEGILQNGPDESELLVYLKQRSDKEGLQEALARFRLIAFQPHLASERTAPTPTADLKSAANSLYSTDFDSQVIPSVRRVPLLQTAWFRYAAVLLLIAGTATFLYKAYQKPPNETLQTTALQQPTDILPGSDKAVLTLAGGEQVRLDSSANALLVAKGISNRNAQISYTNPPQIAVTNILTTPRGGQYKLQLADGTLVWLNAASSITYPTVFTGDRREVMVTGEAYFEVAQNAKQPFIVKIENGASVQVLGTSFNINAYKNEKSINTTLVEGSVKVSSTSSNIILKPGQQAQLLNNQTLTINNSSSNITKALAWRNGYFDFESADLEEVMHQLERWYDLGVVYEKDVPAIHFFGKMRRSAQLSDVLKVLKGAGVNFKIEGGRRLIISP